MKASRITAHVAGAGLFTGAAAWGFHQQLQYVLAALLCRNDAIARMWIVSAIALLIVILGGLLSWAAIRSFASETGFEAQDGLRARHFMAGVGTMGALIFLFAVVLQAIALLFLPVCTG
jgi:hypothetical protein